MRLTFLGTASGTPTIARNVSGGAIRFEDGSVWIIDCGEGTQHQLLRTDLRPGRIDRIFVTHAHGDHCFGLPGLLASIGVHDRTDPVDCHVPAGLGAFVAAARKTTRLHLPYRYRIHEFDGAGPVTRAGSWTVTARALEHRVPSVAFVLREDERRGRCDPEKVAALGIPEGPGLGRLVRGENLELEDGRVITPDQVLGPSRPGRVVVWCGDSADSRAIIDDARDCDVLIHECTFDASRADQAREWGHSTTAEVAALIAECRPRLTVLTHFSARYSTGEGEIAIADLVRAVEAGAPGCAVIAADDLMHLDVPAREA